MAFCHRGDAGVDPRAGSAAAGWEEREPRWYSSAAGLAAAPRSDAGLCRAACSWVSPAWAGGCNGTAVTVQTLVDLNSGLRNSSLNRSDPCCGDFRPSAAVAYGKLRFFSSTESLRNHHEKLITQTGLTEPQVKAFCSCQVEGFSKVFQVCAFFLSLFLLKKIFSFALTYQSEKMI